MQNKASLFLKRLTNYRRFSTTKAFVKAWLTSRICAVVTIIVFCYRQTIRY